jgi:hypothetical protein
LQGREVDALFNGGLISISWHWIDADFGRRPLAKQLAREVKKGRSIQEVGLFGSQTVVLGAGLSKAGGPRLPFCLMVSLLYLKHAYNESDEGLVERWSPHAHANPGQLRPETAQ